MAWRTRIRARLTLTSWLFKLISASSSSFLVVSSPPECSGPFKISRFIIFRLCSCASLPPPFAMSPLPLVLFPRYLSRSGILWTGSYAIILTHPLYMTDSGACYPYLVGMFVSQPPSTKYDRSTAVQTASFVNSLCRSPSAHLRVSTIYTCIFNTHIGISGLISAKQYGLGIIFKAQKILLHPGIVMTLNILQHFMMLCRFAAPPQVARRC
jgi:hypothetical protein